MTEHREHKPGSEGFLQLLGQRLPDAKTDFSGTDVTAVDITNERLHNCLFHGVQMDSCRVSSCSLRHSEFAEARLYTTHFSECDFNHADFIDTVADNCVFERCTFINMEWRESRFHACRFIDCDFADTTMGLSRFDSCDFDETTQKTFFTISKKYNLFVDCSEVPAPPAFLQSNFVIGVPHLPASTLRNETGLHRLAVLTASGSETSADIITLIADDIEQAYGNSTMSLSFARYVSLITMSFTERNRLSPVAMQLLIDQLSRTATLITSHVLAVEVVSLVMQLRAHLLDQCAALNDQAAQTPEVELSDPNMSIVLDPDIPAEDAASIAMHFEMLAGLERGAIVDIRVRKGSTIIEYAVAGVVALTAAITALNLLLNQVDILVTKAGDIRDGVRRLRGTAPNENVEKGEQSSACPVEATPDTDNQAAIARKRPWLTTPLAALSESFESEELHIVRHATATFKSELLNYEGPGRVSIQVEETENVSRSEIYRQARRRSHPDSVD